MDSFQTPNADNKLKVSAVSYLNTKPLIHGLQQSDLADKIELGLEVPSKTAMRLKNGEIDLGLVPVGILPQLNNYTIVTDYCIGTEGEVHTVCLFSEVPLNEIETILLDNHSCTSVRLVQILCKHYWKINPQFVPADPGFESNISGTTAGVIIGDRVFEWESKIKYKHDLGTAWRALTQLPFVFAAWVAPKPINLAIIKDLNTAFAEGIKAIPQVAKQFESKKLTYYNLHHYLQNNINYHFTDDKKKALALFLNYLKNMPIVSNQNEMILHTNKL